MITTELLTARQLADRLHVRPSTIQRWARAGLIPAIHLTPKVVRYDLAEVLRVIREGRRAREVSDAK